MLDIDFARSSFPALAGDWVLMDNAGGSVPLGTAIDRVADYMRRIMVQLGASYEHSVAAGRGVALGKRAAATLVNARSDEIVIGPSSTMNAKILAAALRPLWDEGDEVVVTNLDHETNVGPWRELAGSGIVLREWRFDPETCELEIEDLEPLLSERTRLVCFTHCSNLIGTIHDVAAVTARVHEVGAQVCVDGVACAPHRHIDVRALDVDYYLLSLYKVYGPHLGLLFGKRELLEKAHSRNHFFIGPEEGTYRLEPGNVNHELTAALPAIPEYLAELSRRSGGDGTVSHAFEAIAEHEERLAAPLLAFLRDRPGVRLLGRAEAGPDRAPTISFVAEGRDSSEIPPLLDAARIAVRYGHFYAYRAVEALGLLDRNGVVRISMVHYNTPEEVDRLIETLAGIL